MIPSNTQRDTCLSRTCILGGGMLGLSLAAKLAAAGHKVTVLEAAPTVGGLAGAWTHGGVTWDKHYHVTLLSDTRTRGLLAQLGLESEMQWNQTLTGFFSEGREHSMSTTLEFLRFPLLGLVDKFRLAATILYASRINDWKRMEQVLVEPWLRKLSGDRTFEKIWKPLLRSKLGDSYRITSAAFIWATISRLYAARRSGMKREMFGYVPGGYARILDRLVEHLREKGVDVRCGVVVSRLEYVEGKGLHVIFQDGTSEWFDGAVSTIPSPAVVKICPGLSSSERTRHEGIEYQGIVCASVLLKKPVSRYYVTNITDAGLPFTGVIDMSALVDRKEFGGNALVYLPKYVAPNDPLFQKTDDEVQAEFLSGLDKMYPKFQRSDVLSFRISRVRHVFPIPTLHYSTKLAPVESSVPGLYIVNSSHIVNGTLNVNQTLELAERTAAQFLTSPKINEVCKAA